MAKLTFTIDVPDAAVPRIMAALRNHWGQVEDPPGSGTFRDMTNAELQERFRKLMIDTMRNMVLNREVYEATQSIKTDVSGVSIT